MALYLVTGGCGFIGSHLCEALVRRGDSVRILDDLSTGSIENVPEGVAIVRGSVADPGLVDSLMEDVVGCFHLAAVASVERSTRDWFGSHRTNLSGAIAVFDAARRMGRGRPIPVVYASSAAIYGDCKQLPIEETAPARPRSAYGADKYGCELHAQVASEVYGVPTVGLRFFNVYGPRQDPTSAYSGVISIFCDRLRRGFPIEVFGDGSQTRDFVFVTDVVNALLISMSQIDCGSGVFNVCTGSATSVLRLAQLVGELCERQPEINLRPARSGEITQSVGNSMLIRRRFDLPTPVGLRCGLRKTLSWMEMASKAPIPGGQ
jgi:UDP-glucose 4-epimerase